MRRLYHFAKSFLALSCLVLFLSTGAALAQTTSFTFKGQLTDAGMPANGSYEMQFKLFDALSDGNQIGTTLTFDGAGSNPPVTVTNGVYSVLLDFGAEAFPGAHRYLQVEVRYIGDATFTPLSPRRQFTSTPYAIRTLSATAADSLSPTCNGCVLDAHIQSLTGSKVSGTVANAQIATRAVTAGNVTGVVQINNGGTGSSTQNFVDLSTNQIISGDKLFMGAVTAKNGVFAGNGAGLLNLNGGNLTERSVTRSKLADGVTTRYDLPLLGMLRWDLLPTAKTIVAGGTTNALAFDGTFIYVTSRAGNTVTRIRASTGIMEGFSIHAGGEPCALAFDGTFIYVANRSGNSVTRIRASTGVAEGSPIAVGTNPSALTFDGIFIYVANSGSNNVMRIRASTGVAESHPINVGANPSALAFDGTFIYVANAGNNNVMRIRASTGVAESHPISNVGTSPSSLAFDGTFIYVGNAGSNSVTRIRASNGSLAGGIPVGGRQSALAFDGTFMYVASSSAANVTRIRAFTGVVEGSAIAIGGHVSALAFDGTFVYVADGTSVIRF